MFNDLDADINLENGKVIPTISLKKFEAELGTDSGNSFDLCKYIKNISNKKNLTSLLSFAGERRFDLKAESIFDHLEVTDAEQVLYEYLARSIGYSRNVEPFVRLARYQPVNTFRHNRYRSELRRQAIMLGVAGLLPSQRMNRKLPKFDFKAIKLESAWEKMKLPSLLNEADWNFFRVRPVSSPVRRLIGLSMLIGKNYSPGLLDNLIDLISGALPANFALEIEKQIIIQGSGYWHCHLDFGMRCRNDYSILGYSKAREIVINVLLPFACSFGIKTGNFKMSLKAKTLYFEYPRAENNYIITYMNKLLSLNSKAGVNAVMQQGLIYLFSNFCRTKNCEHCPVCLKRASGWAQHQG
jgi:hypothetical protein